MTNSAADRLADQYLARLADAAQALPPDRRTELVSEIREHIAASMAGGTHADEAAVRTMLDRLGEPADIVDAALEDSPPAPPSNQGLPRGRRQGIGLEVGAVIMLTVGSLIPLGWFVGLILLWSSRLWRRSEKVLGTLIVPGGPGLAVFGGAFAYSMIQPPCVATTPATTDPGQAISGQFIPTQEVCTGFSLAPVLGIALLLLVVIGPVVVAIVLLKRARSRAALEDQ